jgi:uncharacterized cupredoxin-like copper-binding protein
VPTGKPILPIAISFAGLVALALIGSSPVLADAGHGHGHKQFSAGEPGNAKRPARVVKISMREGTGTMDYSPATLEIKRGEQVKFVITNDGELPHEFVLATTEENLKHHTAMQQQPDMGHDDQNAKTVQPKATAEIVWLFSRRGEFEFACLIPGHREAGMTGKITVK